MRFLLILLFLLVHSDLYQQSIVKENVKAGGITGSPELPLKRSFYKEIWHGNPVCQGNSGTCWCYAATSLAESEIKRQQGIEVKLSEMFTVYYEYVDRALDFVRTRGNTTFSEGSEASSIPVIWEKYGIVPYHVYPGKPKSGELNNHREIQKRMSDYLQSVKLNNNWNYKVVEKEIRNILDSELGTPPEKFNYNNIEYTPKSFLAEYLKFNVNDLFSFMSTNAETFNEKHELVEDDNWRHYSNYYNVKIDDFIDIIDTALGKGFSICICGDISEPYYNYDTKSADVPLYDIPSEYIDDNARQFRLGNGSTTDDHCVHIVGYASTGKQKWYLIKDSNYTAFTGEEPGYRFFSEDFMRLKMMNIMLHKGGAKSVLDKIIK